MRVDLDRFDRRGQGRTDLDSEVEGEGDERVEVLSGSFFRRGGRGYVFEFRVGGREEGFDRVFSYSSIRLSVSDHAGLGEE